LWRYSPFGDKKINEKFKIKGKVAKGENLNRTHRKGRVFFKESAHDYLSWILRFRLAVDVDWLVSMNIALVSISFLDLCGALSWL